MDEYLGIIKPYAGFGFVPDGWLPCDGRKLPINGNEALYAIFGTIYGGDGRTNFALPNLNSRAVIGTGQGPSLTFRKLGQSGGAEGVAIDVSTLPAHTHASFALSVNPDSEDPSTHFLTKTANNRYCLKQDGDTEIKMGNDIISTSVGGNLAHDNMPPYMAIKYIICVKGLYPDRP